MPANLTPQYQKAEREYRRAETTQDQVELLEQMLRLIPKHKGTEKLQANLKSRLKETKADLAVEQQSPQKGHSYKIPQQGAGQVILLGGPNAGKSRIVAELTNAHPQVAEFPFSTHEPFPGMMPWEDVFVQLVDTPPITDTHIEPYLTGMVRSADAALLCMNGSSDDAPHETAAVINQLKERKTLLAARTGFDEDDFSIVCVKTLLVVTHADDPECDTRIELLHELESISFPILKVELDKPNLCEELRNLIYDSLDVIRVYTKAPGKPADYRDPFTISRDGTVEDLAYKVHHELAEKLNFAKIWGTSAHDGQSVGRDHRLHDKDLVELHT